MASLLVLVPLLAVLASRGSGFGSRAGAQTLPGPRLRALLSSRIVVPGRLPVIAWPTQGQGAVGVRGVGLMARSPGERPVPIASLTKMMTAYVLLHDHPLRPGEQGPVLAMTASNVASYVRDSQSGDSNVPVAVGERLSEYQLLEALLVPSADNVADLLGAWDAGSDARFVAKMNATARSLGLFATHYADTSGLDPRSRSTAADQVLLAADLMATPVVRSIVRQPSLPFPVAGTITNYNPVLGSDGIVGVKSGFTNQAQGCLATAAYRNVGGRRVLVIAVALGQPDALYGAARSAEGLLSGASQALVAVQVIPKKAPVAQVSVPWSSQTTTADTPPVRQSAVGWPGLVLERSLGALAPGINPGVGVLSVRAPAGVVASVPLVAARPLPAVPAGWSPPSS